MSKFTLGQRKFPTLGLRSQQPKNHVGPTLSCYLGLRSSLFANDSICIFFSLKCKTGEYSIVTLLIKTWRVAQDKFKSG